jgi:hypothetical protein
MLSEMHLIALPRWYPFREMQSIALFCRSMLRETGRDTVTLRDRDSMKQRRIAIGALVNTLRTEIK